MPDTLSIMHPRYWISWFGMAVLRLLGWLPFPVIYALSAVLGEIFYRIIPSRTHITLVNLELCFPEMPLSTRKKMARRHFHLLVCSLLSIGSIWWSRPSRLRRLVTIKGIEHLQAAQQNGHNIILLAPHFVAIDAGGIRLSMDRKMSSMYQIHPNPVIDHFMLKARSRFDGILFDRKASLTGLIRSIRSGAPFYYLPDQNAGAGHGMFVPFFGILASTFPTLGKLTQAGKAVVIPCSSRIIPWRGIETVLGPPLENFPAGDAYEDTLRMNQVVEDMVRDVGADYLWSHKRFKRRPEGEADIYKN